MAIRVSPGAIDTVGDFADGFVIHVTEADDVGRATAGLARAGHDIAALGPPTAERARGPVISGPVLAPGGPLLRIAHLGAGEQALQEVPAIVARRLVEAGVTDALVTAPAPGGPLDDLDVTVGAAVLRLFPHPAGEWGVLAPAWIDVACEWVVGDRAAGDLVPVRLLGVALEVRADEVPSVLHQASQARAWCDVVNGRPDEKVRTASITFGRAPHVALAAGGPGCDNRALLARFDLLGDAARDLADQVAYACVDLEPTFAGIGLGLGADGWRDRGGASPNLVAGELADRWVPDAFPLQILTAEHAARLTAAGVDPRSLGEWITEDRLAVALGSPSDWMPAYERRDEAHRAGLDSLAPLLLRQADVDALLTPGPRGAKRRGRAAGRRGGSGSPEPGSLGLPDLSDISLEALPHARRGLRLSFLELAAWAAHEHHTDAPRSVSPVVATYARWFASALDDERRQALKPLAARLVGTAPDPDAAADSDAEERRAWAAVEWLVRHQAVGWMRAAGLTEAADRLAAVGSLHDPLERARAADVLGAAILIGGHRAEGITGRIEALDADLVHPLEQAVWEAWERAAEASGWVAASEATQVGIPSDLAYATDLQVMECARDPQRRDHLERERRTIGEEAAAAARRAVAAEAWRAGWAAARQVIDQAADLSLATALDRAGRAVVGQGVDPDDLQMAQDGAERAARRRLVELVEDHGEGAIGGAWDQALAAAATSSGGDRWSAVVALARRAVDEATWRAGMGAARAVVAEQLAGAPRLVARSVLAAVAREAAGTAARGAALEATARALGGGAEARTASRAADAALATTAAALQATAFDLLEQLVDPAAYRLGSAGASATR